MSTVVEKLGQKVSAVNTELMTSMNTKLGEGVAAASTAYAGAKLAHDNKDAAVNGAGGLVEVSLSDWEAAKSNTVTAMNQIVQDLQDDGNLASIDDLAALNAKISNQNTAIGGFITGFIGAQDALTTSMITNIGTLAEVEAIFDAEYGAGWDDAISL